MVSYTFLRLDVENDTVAAVLDRVPGVAVGEVAPDDDGGTTSDDEAPVDEWETPVDMADEPGIKDRLTTLVREWGLLGAGVSLIGLGVAAAGFWWYRRRESEGGDSAVAESGDPWPEGEAVTATMDDSGGETPPPTTSEPTSGLGESESTLETDAAASAEGSAGQTVLTATDGDATDERETDEDATVEGAPDEDATAGSPTTERDADTAVGSTVTTADASVDVAPLLGLAFLAVLGVLVRWAQGEDREP